MRSSSRQQLRVDYAPLTLTRSMSFGQALQQVFDSADATYKPDRTLSPLVLTPVVVAVAEDGTVGNYDADGVLHGININASLGDMKWMVNGVDITTLPQWSGKYTIDQSSTEMRGSIAIKRNVPVGESVQLQFTATYPDGRTHLSVPVVIPPVTLITTEKSGDEYAVTFDCGPAALYDPTCDALMRYDYEVANGYRAANDADRQQAQDSRSHIRRIGITVLHGSSVITSDYTLEVYRQSGSNWIKLGDVDSELLSVGTDELWMDLRMITQEQYRVDVMVERTAKDGTKTKEAVASGRFSVVRSLPMLDVRPTNTLPMDPSVSYRCDQAQAIINNGLEPHPDMLLDMRWMTETSKGKQADHNYGSRGVMRYDTMGFDPSSKSVDTQVSTWLEYDWKGACAIATDTDGSMLTDKDGNIYIFTTI